MKISWGDYEAGISASITITPGIDPDELSITIGAPLGGNTLAKSADFTIDDEQGGSITLIDMRAIDGTITKSTSTRQVMFRAHDRRWRWSMKDPISGDYNTKDSSGNVIDNDFKKTAAEIGAILLEAMGETGYSVDGLPTDEYPETSWDTINPAQGLQDLADLYSASIVLGLDNIVNVVESDNGEDELANYNQQIISRDSTQRVERIPANVILVGGFNIDQIEIELTAIGYDPVDEEYHSMTAVTWKPLDGFYPGYEEDLTDEQQTAARDTAFQYYSLPALIEVGGEDIPREQILKYIADEIAEIETKDGDTVQKRPYVTGAHATELSFSSLLGYVTPTDSIVPIGFTIDKKLGVIIFNEPVFDIDSNDKMIGAELNIQMALRKTRFEQEYPQPNGLESTSAFVKRSDIFYLKKDGAILNEDVLTDANKAVAGVVAGFVTDEPLTIQYSGICSDYAPSGKIEQLTFAASISSGPVTTVSWKTEHDPIKPTKIQRKSAINSQRVTTERLSGQRPPVPINERHSGQSIQITNTAQDQGRGKVTQRKIINNSGVVVPPGSFCLKDDVDSDGFLQVIKPDEASLSANKLVITSPYFEIPVGGKSIAMEANSGGLAVKYSSTAPTKNQAFGTQASSFEGLAGNTGFTADGVKEGLAYASSFRDSGIVLDINWILGDAPYYIDPVYHYYSSASCITIKTGPIGSSLTFTFTVDDMCMISTSSITVGIADTRKRYSCYTAGNGAVLLHNYGISSIRRYENSPPLYYTAEIGPAGARTSIEFSSSYVGADYKAAFDINGTPYIESGDTLTIQECIDLGILPIGATAGNSYDIYIGLQPNGGGRVILNIS